MHRLQLFISSAFQSLRYEREFLCLACERMGWEALYYPEQSHAGSPSRDYLRRLRDAHVLVYIIGQHASAAAQQELDLARDLGIPIVPFARWTQTRNGRRRPKAADAFVAQTGAEFVQGFDSLRELEEGLVAGVSAVIADRVARSNVSLEPYSEHLYVEARELLGLAERRYAIAQKTSTLALGAHRSRIGPEDSWLSEWHEAILGVLSGKDGRELVHIFDSKATLTALTGAERANFPEAADAIAFMRAILPRLGSTPAVRIIARQRPVAPAVLSDGGLLIPATYEVTHYFRVGHALTAANQLWEVLNRIAGEEADAMAHLEDFVGRAEVAVR
jgi:hypothetical protein